MNKTAEMMAGTDKRSVRLAGLSRECSQGVRGMSDLNQIYADVNEDDSVGEPNFQWVVLASEALAREAEVCRLYDSLVKRSNMGREASYKREAALREELESIKASVDGYDSPEHAAQVADTLGHANTALQQRLTVAEQRADDLESLVRDVEPMVAKKHSSPWFAKRYAALKPAADAKPSRSCPNCKVCMGSPDFPENCLINGVKP